MSSPTAQLEGDHPDHPDFVALYQTYARDIYAYCLRRLPESEAQDAAAEVFTVVWRRRHDLPYGPSELPWIYGVARNVLANRNRAARRRSRLEARLSGLRAIADTDPETGPERRLDRLSDHQLVRTAMEQLSERDQETIRLVEWEGLSREQVATMFGVSRSAIDQRLSRAYRRLEVLLSAERPGHGESPDRGPEGRGRGVRTRGRNRRRTTAGEPPS